MNRRKLVPLLLVLAVAAVAAVGACRTGTGPSVLDVTVYSNAEDDCVRDHDARASTDECRAVQRAAWCARFPSQPNCDGGTDQ
jgi:hypothetical protein